jgi:small subunit ribosomal protein S3
MKKAEAHVQLKPGIIGVRVKIMPPDAYFPDKIQIVDTAPVEEKIAADQTEAKQLTQIQQQASPQAEEVHQTESEAAVQATEVADETEEGAKE